MTTFEWIESSDPAYADVVALRRLAYGAAGKVDPRHDAMQDAFDPRSAILVATEDRVVVGSLRLNPYVRGASEYDELVHLPDDFPPPHTTVLTRVCTHPSARGRGLVYSLMREAYAEARRRGFAHVIGACTAQLLELYQRVGLRPCGITFTHTKLNGIHEHLLFRTLDDE